MKLTLNEAERLAYIKGNTRLADLLDTVQEQDELLMGVRDDAKQVISHWFAELTSELDGLRPDLGQNQQTELFGKIAEVKDGAHKAMDEEFGDYGSEHLYFEARRYG